VWDTHAHAREVFGHIPATCEGRKVSRPATTHLAKRISRPAPSSVLGGSGCRGVGLAASSAGGNPNRLTAMPNATTRTPTAAHEQSGWGCMGLHGAAWDGMGRHGVVMGWHRKWEWMGRASLLGEDQSPSSPRMHITDVRMG